MNTDSAAFRRRAIIALARRRGRAGSGSGDAFMRTRSFRVMPDLTRLLAGLPFVIVGGTATALYMPARHTDDVDILVSTADLVQIERALRSAGARRQGPLTIGGAAWTLQDGTDLDVIVSDAPWVPAALATPVRDPTGLPVIDLPYLVLLKLEASRLVDIGDLGRMLGGADDQHLRRVRLVVARHMPDAVDDLESIIELGKLEFISTRPAIASVPAAADLPTTTEEVIVRAHVRKGRSIREHTRHHPRR